jgi:tetratricopeptide (TPR) repeat protein
LLAAPALAQARLSLAGESTLAYKCYVAAVVSAKQARVRRNDPDNCNAALDGPLSQKDRAATYDNRGVIYEIQQLYPAALSDFNASIGLNEGLGDAWLNRGVVLIHMNRAEDALADIQQGIARGISLPGVGYFDRGVAEAMLGRVKEAYEDFKRALAEDPNFTAAADALKNFSVVPAGGPGG